MQDNTEDKMFKALLSDYAEPAQDDGFSDFVLASLPKARNTKLIKSAMVGGAGALGAAIALPKISSLYGYFSGLKVPALPAVETPSLDVGALANSSFLASSYTPVLLGLGILLTIWMGHALIFGDDA